MGVFEYALLAQDDRVIAISPARRQRFVSSPLRHPFKKAVTPFDFGGYNCFGRRRKGLYMGHRRVKYPALTGARNGPQGPSIDAGKGLANHDCQTAIAGSDAPRNECADRARWVAGCGFTAGAA